MSNSRFPESKRPIPETITMEVFDKQVQETLAKKQATPKPPIVIKEEAVESQPVADEAQPPVQRAKTFPLSTAEIRKSQKGCNLLTLFKAAKQAALEKAALNSEVLSDVSSPEASSPKSPKAP